MIYQKAINSIKKVFYREIIYNFNYSANKIIDVLCCKANVEGLNTIQFDEEEEK